ncbi:MAG TPA: hypothetical protein VK673_10880 [Chthoniobacterales bacterium]|nr:hypothetical protein [Chthoniobacterales bacterium]
MERNPELEITFHCYWEPVSVQRHSELVTVPARIFERWAKEGMPPGEDFAYKPFGAETPYEELNLEQLWE